jgi:hypothetical protein
MRDRWVRVLAGLMAAISAPLLVMLVLAPIAAVRVLAFDWDRTSPDDRFVFAIAMPLAFVLGLYGVATAVVARGLWRGRRWAGLWGLFVCFSWCIIGLVPFGGFGLWALLRPAIRREWMD